MIDSNAIKEKLEYANTYQEVCDVLADEGVAWILDDSDFVTADDVADRFAQDLHRNGLEAMRDYRDIDPYGDVFRDTGMGYFEDASVEDVKEFVNDALDEMDQANEQER